MDSASEMTYNVSSGALNSTHSLTPGMEVPFGGLDNYIWYLDPYIFEKLPFLGPILTGLGFFAARKSLSHGDALNIKVSLIDIVAP